MSTQSVADLLGEDVNDNMGLGEDQAGENLYAGYIPDRSLLFMPQAQIGDGLAGPENEQQLVIYRDNRVIATDELGAQGPFQLRQGAIARHRAGRMFPLNYEYGPSSLDQSNYERVPIQEAREMSPFSPGQLPHFHAGVMPPEVLPATFTVPYTFSPDVGYQSDGS